MEKPPNQPRLALAEQLANKILKAELIFRPPVPVHEVLEQFALVRFFKHRVQPSFCLEQDSIWRVYINSALAKDNLDYKEAQEMGHLFLHHLEYDLSRITAPQSAILNREATYFADNFLMPAGWVCSACSDKPLNPSTEQQLADLFHVKHATMSRRLHHLGLYCREDF